MKLLLLLILKSSLYMYLSLLKHFSVCKSLPEYYDLDSILTDFPPIKMLDTTIQLIHIPINHLCYYIT